jgi:hypothetical protein
VIDLKRMVAGVVAAIIAVIVWVFVNAAILFMSISGLKEGSGGIGFIVTSNDIYMAAIFGFAIGFYWQVRRSRRLSKFFP